jgi:hypothetical protein
MRKRVFLLLLPITVLIACERIDDAALVDKASLIQGVLTRASETETITLDHSISLEQAEQIVRKRFPEKKAKSIRIIRESDEDVLYVADFECGWAIIAGDDRSKNMIIAYDDEGSFDPENIDNPGVRVWYEMEKERLLQLRKLKDVRTVPIATRGVNDYEPYYWLGFHIGTDYSCTSGTVNHLLETKWGQGYPWNVRCPVYSFPYQCPVGCLAVATGQILYYLQVHKGFSIGLYHTVNPAFTQIDPIPTYAICSMVYSDYNEPSSRWVAMPKTNNGLNSSYVADLLIDIGYRFGFTFTPEGSGSVYIAPVFDTFNVNSLSGVFFFPFVKESLDDGFPVMVVAYENLDYSNSHAWVIDGYQLSEYYTDKSYSWRIVPSDSLSYYSGYQFCYTEAQKQLLAPDANEDEIYHVIDTTGGNYLMMNWGYDGAGDNGFYSMNNYHWPDGYNNQFKYHPFITYDFNQEDEPE